MQGHHCISRSRANFPKSNLLRFAFGAFYFLIDQFKSERKVVTVFEELVLIMLVKLIPRWLWELLKFFSWKNGLRLFSLFFFHIIFIVFFKDFLFTTITCHFCKLLLYIYLHFLSMLFIIEISVEILHLCCWFNWCYLCLLSRLHCLILYLQL